METAAQRSSSRRINGRMLVFVALLVFLLGWPVYAFLSESLTHGIHDHGTYKEVNLQAMGHFAFDPTGGSLTDVPAVYRGLDGQKVSLDGAVFVRDSLSSEITHWELVYNVAKCCLGTSPQVQERVYCTAPAGKSFHRKGEHHRVTGTLHVKLKQAKLPDGRPGLIEEVYHLDADSVQPL